MDAAITNLGCVLGLEKHFLYCLLRVALRALFCQSVIGQRSTSHPYKNEAVAMVIFATALIVEFYSK